MVSEVIFISSIGSAFPNRIVVHGQSFNRSVVPSSAKPFNFQEEYRLTEEQVTNYVFNTDTNTLRQLNCNSRCGFWRKASEIWQQSKVMAKHVYNVFGWTTFAFAMATFHWAYVGSFTYVWGHVRLSPRSCTDDGESDRFVQSFPTHPKRSITG